MPTGPKGGEAPRSRGKGTSAFYNLHRQRLEIWASKLKSKSEDHFGNNGHVPILTVHAFERVEHNRLLLAAHRERTERATRHADGKRADALNQRR